MIASNKVNQLLTHIKFNLSHLGSRVRILRLKYSKYKKYYDKFNILVIIISTILTIVEAMKSQFKNEIEGSIAATHIFDIIPIFMACTITLMTSIIKFKKLQEKMENISKFNRKKLYFAMSKLKKNIRITIFFQK